MSSLKMLAKLQSKLAAGAKGSKGTTSAVARHEAGPEKGSKHVPNLVNVVKPADPPVGVAPFDSSAGVEHDLSRAGGQSSTTRSPRQRESLSSQPHGSLVPPSSSSVPPPSPSSTPKERGPAAKDLDKWRGSKSSQSSRGEMSKDDPSRKRAREERPIFPEARATKLTVESHAVTSKLVSPAEQENLGRKSFAEVGDLSDVCLVRMLNLVHQLKLRGHATQEVAAERDAAVVQRDAAKLMVSELERKVAAEAAEHAKTREAAGRDIKILQDELGAAKAEVEAAKAKANEAQADAQAQGERAGRFMHRSQERKLELARVKLELARAERELAGAKLEGAREFTKGKVYKNLVARALTDEVASAVRLSLAQLKYKGFMSAEVDESVLNLDGDETGADVDFTPEQLAELQAGIPAPDDPYFSLMEQRSTSGTNPWSRLKSLRLSLPEPMVEEHVPEQPPSKQAEQPQASEHPQPQN